MTKPNGLPDANEAGIPPSLLELAFTGQLSDQANSQDVTGTFNIARDGTIGVTLTPIPFIESSSWLLGLMSDRGRTAKWMTLDATSEGKQLRTEYLIITSHTPNLRPEGGSTISLSGQASTLTITYAASPLTSEGCALRYRMIGMRGFGQQRASTDVGEIFLSGQPKIANHDDIAGRVIVKATESQAIDAWIAAADDALEHILKVVSLADGKPLSWSLRELFHNDRLVQITFYGARHTGSPQDNVFHFLDLWPVLTLAVNKYTPALRARTGIELAIDLFLLHPSHLELRLITAMTALEHLVSIHQKSNPVAPPLDDTTFKQLKRALKSAYDDTSRTLTPGDELKKRLARVRERIGNLNHVTFKDRLWPMLRDYGVPLVGIESRINDAIEARHDIVHTGMHAAPFESFYLHVAVLRELLKRIFLTLLCYEGQYQSYLNGPQWLAFPPTDTVIVE